MKSDARDEFDSLLDAALESYANVEPPPGMEQRIVARLRVSDRRAGFGWWRWAAVAIPALACLGGGVRSTAIGHRSSRRVSRGPFRRRPCSRVP